MKHLATIATAIGLTLSGAAIAADPIKMEVAWTDEKCDFIVTKNAAGHGIAMRLTPLPLIENLILKSEQSVCCGGSAQFVDPTR